MDAYAPRHHRRASDQLSSWCFWRLPENENETPGSRRAASPHFLGS